MELNPAQVRQVNDAELVMYLKGFQPAVDDAIKLRDNTGALDVGGTVPLADAAGGAHQHEGEESTEDGKDHGAKDPHVWLDPTRLAIVGEAVADRLAKADSTHAADYHKRAATLRTDLEKLDKEYAEGLKTCQRRELVVSHSAFGYLAERYRLEQIGLSGLSPDADPSPRRLTEVIEEARKHKATTIFFETLVSPKVAETIAREVEAKTAVLDPLEGLQPGGNDDYFSIMRKNLAALRTALGCS